MSKKILIVDDFKKLTNIENEYDGYVVSNGIYAFYGNTRNRINRAKKVLIKKLFHCVDKMKENGWEVVNG